MDSLTSTHSLGSVECDKLISLLVVVSAMIARGRPCMEGYVRATAAWSGRVVVADCAGRYLCTALLCFTKTYKNSLRSRLYCYLLVLEARRGLVKTLKTSHFRHCLASSDVAQSLGSQHCHQNVTFLRPSLAHWTGARCGSTPS